MYSIEFDPEFKEELDDLGQVNPDDHDVIIRKIKDIAKALEWNSNHHKNLRKPLNKFKRVHVNDHFVLVFRVNQWNKTVCFIAYGHHDDIYKDKRLFEY